MNGKATNISVAANCMPRFMKSIAFSRFHRYSADEPVYFSLPDSIPCRTRCRTPDRSRAVTSADCLAIGCTSKAGL